MVLNFKTRILHDIFHGYNCQSIMWIENILSGA